MMVGRCIMDLPAGCRDRLSTRHYAHAHPWHARGESAPSPHAPPRVHAVVGQPLSTQPFRLIPHLRIAPGRPGASCSMMQPTRSNKPDGYLLGSYRIATAPEPNSSRLTSFKSTHFDNPANNVGPWPTSLGCTTNSYSSINPSSANASGSFTPPTSSPLPDSRLSC